MKLLLSRNKFMKNTPIFGIIIEPYTIEPISYNF